MNNILTRLRRECKTLGFQRSRTNNLKKTQELLHITVKIQNGKATISTKLGVQMITFRLHNFMFLSTETNKEYNAEYSFSSLNIQWSKSEKKMDLISVKNFSNKQYNDYKFRKTQGMC